MFASERWAGRAEDAEGLAAAGLGGLERGIGAPEGFFRQTTIDGGDADGGSDIIAPAVAVDGLVEHGNDARGQLRRAGVVGGSSRMANSSPPIRATRLALSQMALRRCAVSLRHSSPAM